jgi:hypothetical protein
MTHAQDLRQQAGLCRKIAHNTKDANAKRIFLERALELAQQAEMSERDGSTQAKRATG